MADATWLSSTSAKALATLTTGTQEIRVVDDPSGSPTSKKTNLAAIRTWLFNDLGSISDSAKGAALIGYKPTFSGAVGRTLSSALMNTINLKDFGAVGDGVTDDAAAIQAWLNALSAGQVGYAPAGTYKFNTVLTHSTARTGIIGDGPYQTRFLYGGAATTGDLITIGSRSSNTGRYHLADFWVDSNTTMTGGNALRLSRVTRSNLNNITIGGQDGNNKLYDCVWFDSVDCVTYTGLDIKALNDGLKVSGVTGEPQADLFIANGKISGCGRNGLVYGGGFGGLYVDSCDIIGSISHNVVCDQSLQAEANREAFFGPGCFIDSGGGAGVYINGSGGYISFSGTWNASNAANGVDITSSETSTSTKVQFSGGTIFNNTGDGIKVSHANPTVVVDGVLLRNNTGYGVNNAASSTNLLVGANYFQSNTSGQTNGAGYLAPFAGNVVAANTSDAASVLGLVVEGDRATVANNDEVYVEKRLSNAAGTQTAYGRWYTRATDTTAGSEDAIMRWAIAVAGSMADKLALSGTELRPTVNDNIALGSATVSFADLFLASGGVINFNNGNLTITHSAGALAVTGVTTVASGTATPAGGSTSARLLFGTTAGFGIYYGSGAPTVSAAQGSLYLRSDGSTTNNRIYVNTNGSTTWTAMTTVA